MKIGRRYWAILVIAVALFFLMTACGTDSDSIETETAQSYVDESVEDEPTAPDVDTGEDEPTAPDADAEEDELTTPGEDVVEIVNLRGDETTVYKLVDGRYMDRIDRIFIYDGEETWTDEDGVEWNEVAK